MRSTLLLIVHFLVQPEPNAAEQLRLLLFLLSSHFNSFINNAEKSMVRVFVCLFHLKQQRMFC